MYAEWMTCGALREESAVVGGTPFGQRLGHDIPCRQSRADVLPAQPDEWLQRRGDNVAGFNTLLRVCHSLALTSPSRPVNHPR